MNRYKYVIILALALGACRVGRNYERPSLPLPASYAGVATGDTLSIASTAWAQFYTDPLLRQLIDTAVKNNYDLQTALTRIATSGQEVRRAKAAFLPTLSAQVGANTSIYGKNTLNGLSYNAFLGKDHLEDYSVQANLSWEADIWGRIRRQKEAALATYLQTQEAARAVQTTIVSDVAQGYYNLLMLDAQLDIAKHSLALGDSILAMTKLQKDAGDVTQLAVEQADAQRQAAAILVPQLQASIGIQENALHILTGTIPGTPVAREADIRTLTVPDHLDAGVPAALVSRRPDVRAAEMGLVAANAQVGSAQANLYPVLSITAGGGLDAFKASNWFSIPNSLFGLLGGTLVEPILQGRARKTQFEEAKITREQNVIYFRQSVLNAVGEVSNALVSYTQLQDQERIASARLGTLRSAVGHAELLFKSGLATYLEVITAQGNLLSSELDYASVKRQQLSEQVELYRSLGGGWQ
ncbi:efflux transporter outer membrane subunit [Dinghuibacter silviterrae]|uniref:NodT family efflux transporter outer membrane factor (OMF) lipoprotein n=1 Tax=Dinghuibacter silviterrae TaxID=1539049 RepID=A0A4R8DWM9_9BACT|nr:efflux transporter outer membrane subunit [Dinghuibacter silviterrae]TDX01621.1 NodT family efflux transporter outer membrane factor (OMF) lipoprotein [Dinghuibacter silviterrae]